MECENKLIISEDDTFIITASYESGRICRIQAEKKENEGILGNIYIGKVRNIVKNINAAFVEFQKGQMGYLALNTNVLPIHTSGLQHDADRILIGDEIIVQIEKEALKTKPPTLTGKLELSGKFFVLCVGADHGSVSRKIRDKERREYLQAFVHREQTPEYGWIARTNSEQASEEELLSELETLKKRYTDIITFGVHKTIYSCLYQAPSAFLGSIRDMYTDHIKEVITDSEELYHEVDLYVQENTWENNIKVSLWEETHGKMRAVYNLDKTIERALQPRVWLKSGAYLIIQPTEALVAIDVNTGKAVTKKKDVEKHFLKINSEAAREIGMQLRLRNLSGIILVDFIDMKSKEANEELLEILRTELRKDPVPTKVIDMTKLGLVEITRKKVRKSLYEQMQ